MAALPSGHIGHTDNAISIPDQQPVASSSQLPATRRPRAAVTAPLSAPEPSSSSTKSSLSLQPSHGAAQPRDDDTGGVVLTGHTSDTTRDYQRTARPPSKSPLARHSRGRRPRISLAADQQDPWFHITITGATDSTLAIAHEPPVNPNQAPALTLSHRAGLRDCDAIFLDDEQWQACEDAGRQQRQRLASTRRTPSKVSSARTPSLSSRTASLNVDSSVTPATDPCLSHSDTPLSPSIKSDRIDEADTAIQTQSAPKKPNLPAWSKPRSWAGLVSKDSGATNFVLPDPASMQTPSSTNPTPSAAVSEVGSPSVTSPRTAAGSTAAKKPWQGQQRLSLEAILSDVHTNFRAPVTLPRGLINTGNFCFANAILQVLVFCAPFYNVFDTVGKELAADLANSTPLIEAVVQFLREFHLAGKTRAPRDAAGGHGELAPNPQLSEPFVPEFVYEAMRLNKRFDLMRRGHQEDAEEFLGFFLDTLHEELLAAMRKSAARLAASTALSRLSPAEQKLNGVSDPQLKSVVQSGGLAALPGDEDSEEAEREVARPVSPTEEGWMEVGQKGKTAFTRTTSTSESPITRIFGGKLRSVLRTPGAKDSVTLEPYQPLQLDIQPQSVQTIEDALLNLTVPETIPGVFSPARGGPVDATKQVFIERTPPVLILHLKRFFYDEVGGVQKNSKEVGYKDVLEVGGDMVSPTKRLDGPVKYRLFGVVYHHGRFASGGHYTVDVLRQDGSSWVHFDDTMFNHVAPEHVGRRPNANGTGVMANGSGSGPGHDGLAYLLFYRRDDGSSTPQTFTPDVASSKTNGVPWAAIGSQANRGKGGAAGRAVNGQASGHHTRESSAASASNRFAQVEQNAHRNALPSTGRNETISSPPAKGKSRDREHSQRGGGESGSKSSSKVAAGAGATGVQSQPSQPQTRVVPGAAPGKVRKVKS